MTGARTFVLIVTLVPGLKRRAGWKSTYNLPFDHFTVAWIGVSPELMVHDASQLWLA